MASGGARNRSGPAFDPDSARSDRRGVSLTALPSEGFTGVVPEFPLPVASRYVWEYEDKKRYKVYSSELTGAYRDREVEIWGEAWRTPQACAWSIQSWRWTILGEYCRLKTIVEMDADSTAALVGQLHRYRDQLGLTPAGLKDNGWAIAEDEVSAKRDEVKPVRSGSSVRSRLAAVNDGG